MKSIVLSAVVSTLAIGSLCAKEVGKPAPDFTAKNLKGESVSLEGLKGKTVVLEWVNFECPFVQKHYGSKNLQELQKTYTDQGIVWISVSTGEAPSAEKLAEFVEKNGNRASEVILDPDGKIGKAYDAKTTPQLYIIDKEGTLVYNGAIDSISSTKAEDVKKADKWFVNAIDAVIAGKEVPNAKNQPYGCNVKY